MSRFVPILVLALALVAGTSALAQDAPAADALLGTWEGRIDPADLDLFVVLRFEAGPDGPTGSLDVPLQGATDLPLEEIEAQGDGHVRFVAPTLPGTPVFEGDLNGDELAGTFTQGDVAVPFELGRAGERAAVPTPEGWAGSWSGVLAPDRAPLPMRLAIASEGGRMTATLALPSQLRDDVEARPASSVDGGVTFELPALPADARLGLRLVDGRLVGTFQQEGVTFPITFTREGDEAASAADPDRPQTPTPPFPYATEEVTFAGGDGELAGVLSLPDGDGPHPVVVMLNGSGPQDRDGTVYGHAVFAVIADHLARAGVGTLRWDDRGVGGSEGDLGAAGHDGLVRDAVGAVRFLAARDDVDATRIAVFGHSEGGIIAPRVANAADAPVAALVLAAAPAVSGLDVLELQNRLILGAQGATEQEIDAQIAYLRALAENLEAGETEEARRLTRARIDVQLAALPPEQLPTGEARERLIEAQVDAAGTPTFRDFVLAQPQEALREVAVPTLAVYARQDVQVPAAQNEGPMRAALRLAGAEDATVVTLPGLNHLLQPASSGGLEEYAQIRTTVAPEALELLTDWLRARLVE
jgi:pimeloyl-ACP methyl ester carboxylesterase